MLPTDEEINGPQQFAQQMQSPVNKIHLEYHRGYQRGAVWMRDTYAKPLQEENESLKKKEQFARESNLENYKQLQEQITENERLEKQLEIAKEALDKFININGKGVMFLLDPSTALSAIKTISKEALERIKQIDEEKK